MLGPKEGMEESTQLCKSVYSEVAEQVWGHVFGEF